MKGKRHGSAAQINFSNLISVKMKVKNYRYD